MASPLPPSPVGVRVRVPAKINLALKVGPPRPDGFHPLATVYQAVSLYDEVHAAWADPERVRASTVTGEGADLVPLDDSNLAVRAARLLARTHGAHDSLGVSLSINKSIPVAGGLAGGSANGAAALLACAALWDIDVSAGEPAGAGRGARQRRAVRPDGRHRGRQRPGRGSRAGPGPGHVPLGARLRPPPGSPRPRLPPLRRAQPRRRPSPRSRPS